MHDIHDMCWTKIDHANGQMMKEIELKETQLMQKNEHLAEQPMHLLTATHSSQTPEENRSKVLCDTEEYSVKTVTYDDIKVMHGLIAQAPLID